ncbi:TfoX/Sxy family protein [Gemmobacter serpentinus]|uniref:TfoX/Sxy family protein n=1 Tax=Gemmobacter serpentinus TaxID=2652247 RepID=UPI00124C885C|nr:TfoX/Sxy family protein [Gemmobacter serpentinus]
MSDPTANDPAAHERAPNSPSGRAPAADPISSIPNLGPASEAGFARAGIHTATELRALGADAAYLALLRHGTTPHFIGYYVLVMGLQGRPWNDCKGDEKKALRIRFDALKAEALAQAAPSGLPRDLEAALNALGVRAG